MSADCFDIWVKGAGKNAELVKEDISKAQIRVRELIPLCTSKMFFANITNSHITVDI